MFKNYLKFLEYLSGNLNRYFEAQSPFIKCKIGCSKCCSNGDYPFSEMEINLLKIGFDKLDEETQKVILDKIKQIIDEKENYAGEKSFTYECPFLIDNKCSVYDYRGLICRTFGLIYIKEGSNMQIPFCAYEGLNYSNVLDKEKDMLVEEKLKELGIKEEPKAYNIHYDFLTSERVGDSFGFKFGRRGSLIDLLKDNPNFYKK